MRVRPVAVVHFKVGTGARMSVSAVTFPLKLAKISSLEEEMAGELYTAWETSSKGRLRHAPLGWASLS